MEIIHRPILRNGLYDTHGRTISRTMRSKLLQMIWHEMPTKLSNRKYEMLIIGTYQCFCASPPALPHGVFLLQLILCQ